MFKGKSLNIHGSFASKADAVEKEREVGGFIRRTTDRFGNDRYTVFSRSGAASRRRKKRKSMRRRSW